MTDRKTFFGELKRLIASFVADEELQKDGKLQFFIDGLEREQLGTLAEALQHVIVSKHLSGKNGQGNSGVEVIPVRGGRSSLVANLSSEAMEKLFRKGGVNALRERVDWFKRVILSSEDNGSLPPGVPHFRYQRNGMYVSSVMSESAAEYVRNMIMLAREFYGMDTIKAHTAMVAVMDERDEKKEQKI